MKWQDVSETSRDAMIELGAFHPTDENDDVNALEGFIVDYSFNGIYRVKWTSDDLRKMAVAFAEVADWLDKRAAEAKGE